MYHPQDPDWRPAFLAALRKMPVITRAAEAAGVDRSTVFRRRQSDPDFDAAFADAFEAGVDAAEAELFRRAVIGFEEPVIHQGVLAYRTKRVVAEDGSVAYEPLLDTEGQPVPLTVRKHSDSLLATYVKGRRKQVFADRTELTGADGGPVKTTDETQRSARVAQLMALAQARRALQRAEDEFSDLA